MNPERTFSPRLVALFTTTLFVGGAACERDAQVATTVEEVKDWPAGYMGKVVTLVGEVEEHHASGSFRLDGKGTWWDDEILVVVPREQAATLAEGADVRVTGEIALFTVTEVERDYGIDLANEVEVEFRDKPIVIARNIDVLTD
jgi:hypothetical protein